MNEEANQTQEAATGEAQTSVETTAPVIEGWRSDLSEDLQSNESLKNFNDIDALAKSFIETKRMQGNSIHLLNEDASPEQRAQQAQEIMDKIPGYMQKPDFENAEQSNSFWHGLGTPEDANGYDAIEGLSEAANSFSPIMHKANLTKTQYNSVMKEIAQAENEQAEANTKAFNEATQSLRKEWGQAYEDKYNQAAHMAKIVSDATGNSNDFDAFSSGNASPAAIKAFSAIYDMMGGEGAAVVKDNNSSSSVTPNEAQEKIDAINNNPEHPFWNVPSGTAERKRLDDYMHTLMEAKKAA